MRIHLRLVLFLLFFLIGFIYSAQAQVQNWAMIQSKTAVSITTLEQKASMGNADAQFELGFRHENTLDRHFSRAEAVEWYRRAAEQGHQGAQTYLALRYANGNGVARDHVEAYKWASIAAEQNTKASRIRRSIAKTMTDQEIARGEQLARIWLAHQRE